MTVETSKSLVMSRQRSSFHGSSASFRSKFDVFLSFQDEDTSKSFTDHLCAAFNKKEFKVFKSIDEELDRGKLLSAELVEAVIEESRISVVVFSKSYASSTRCLDELVKIVHCTKTSEQMVLIPIFYDVEPSAMRHQNGVFQEAFAGHEGTFKENREKVKIWRNTLREVANISGFHLKDRYKSEFIEDIVKEISSKIRRSTSTSTSGLMKMMNLQEKLVVGPVSSCLEKLQRQAEMLRERVQWGEFSIAPTIDSLFFLVDERVFIKVA